MTESAAESLVGLTARIEAHYQAVAAGPMADVPLCNPNLGVRLLGVQDWEGLRVGVLVMPWAINLILLPGSRPWPAQAPLSKQLWSFPSGDYAFIHGEDAGFGPYQMCSLFSPALEFESMAQACETAQAALLALLRAPMSVPDASSPVPDSDVPARRRWLLGRGAGAAGRPS